MRTNLCMDYHELFMYIMTTKRTRTTQWQIICGVAWRMMRRVCTQSVKIAEQTGWIRMITEALRNTSTSVSWAAISHLLGWYRVAIQGASTICNVQGNCIHISQYNKCILQAALWCIHDYVYNVYVWFVIQWKCYPYYLSNPVYV